MMNSDPTHKEFQRHLRQSCLLQLPDFPLDTHCKTKVSCTIGPSTVDPEKIKQLVTFGMSIMRLNMSHCSYEFAREAVEELRKYQDETNATRMVGILLDLNGAKLRTGKLENGKPVYLKSGDTFTFVLSSDPSFIGNRHQTFATIPRNSVKPGDKIFVDDGLICLTANKIIYPSDASSDTKIECLVDNSGMLGEQKGINIPNYYNPSTSLTARDILDIEFGLELGVDFIALSCIHSAEEVMEARKLLGDSRTKLLAKIENKDGLDQFDRILKVSDGIIIDRGYLGVEIDITRIAVVQKNIIEKCHLAGKPVLLANQILESMTNLPRPSRSESSDITSAVVDGADAIILSGETAVGQYPLESLIWIRKICLEAENHVDYQEYQQLLIRTVPKPLPTSEAIACAAVKCASEIKAACIIVYTEGGGTARLVAKYRPNIPIVVTTNSALTARQVAISFGVLSYFQPNKSYIDESESLNDTIKFVVDYGIAKHGDHVVITMGHLVGFVEGSTTNMRVHTIV